jgi:hypothetical protein
MFFRYSDLSAKTGSDARTPPDPAPITNRSKSNSRIRCFSRPAQEWDPADGQHHFDALMWSMFDAEQTNTAQPPSSSAPPAGVQIGNGAGPPA